MLQHLQDDRLHYCIYSCIDKIGRAIYKINKPVTKINNSDRRKNCEEDDSLENWEKVSWCVLKSGRKVTTGHNVHANCERKELSWSWTKNLSSGRRVCTLVGHQRYTLTSTHSFDKYFAGCTADDSDPSVHVALAHFFVVWQFHKCNEPGDKRGVTEDESCQHILLSGRCNDLHVTVPSDVFFSYCVWKQTNAF